MKKNPASIERNANASAKQARADSAKATEKIFHSKQPKTENHKENATMKTKKISLKKITDAGHNAEDADMVRALCAFLDCQPDDLSRERYDHYGLAVFSYGREDYAIGTDEEADQACAEYVKDSAWAFNASFVLSECGLPSDLEEAIQTFQSEKCESANDAIVALIEKTCGMDEFIKAAISADGRGHFLSGYDGNENDSADGAFVIYRTN